MKSILLASGDLWAGAEVVVYQLVKGFRSFSDLQLIVILLNNGRLADEIEKLEVDVRIVNEASCTFYTLSLAIRVIIRDFAPDIVHSHRYKENLFAWLATRGMKNTRIVATQHGMPEATRGIGAFRSRPITFANFWLLSRCFNQTVVVSQEMRNTLFKSHGFKRDNVTVIHNGVFVPAVTSKERQGRLTIGSSGRLFPVKDFSCLVDIAAQVVQVRDDVDFVLAGDGPERPLLEKKISHYGLRDRFKLLGHQDDMNAFYRSLDVYMNTSVHEGIPMSVLEAMSHGVPVIVPNIGGLPEIVEEGQQGYLIGSRDPTNFAEKCVLLCNDEAMRSRMAARAIQRVANSFSREAMAHKYYHLYQELLNNPSMLSGF